MKSIHAWLDEYAASHRNAQNKLLHRICVPLIVWSALGMTRAIPLGNDVFNACTVAIALMLAYYAMLSWRLAVGMTLALSLTYLLVQLTYHGLGGLHIPLMIAIFVVAWIGQFIGHKIEGAKPSFFKDLQFLLIGPLWLLADLYRSLSLNLVGSRTAQQS